MADQQGKVLALPSAPDAIELRHLRAFVAVAEELNFGRAASRLYLSQPALSRQIRALERLVGCDLLRRSTHQVELTIGGEALVDRARRLLGDLDEAVTVTRSLSGELAGRMTQLWEPFTMCTPELGELQSIRNAVEELHGQFPVPEEVTVRPVNAAGVPSLLVVPPAAAPPALLFLHGGGYSSGSAFGYRHLAGALTAATELSALVPEYRLAPEHPYPAALEDATRAYTWLLDGGRAPEEIVIAGDSAGGGLAMSLLLSLDRQSLPLPGGVVLLCPWVDLTCESLGERPVEEADAVITQEQGQVFAEAYLGGHPVDDPVLSPLTADLTGLPPMLIQAATGDPARIEARHLAERARAAGVDVHLELYPVLTHDFHVFWSFLPEARDAIHQAGEFVAELRRRGSLASVGRPQAVASWRATTVASRREETPSLPRIDET
jgi:monoterpene epsilon-lactone hydrolase